MVIIYLLLITVVMFGTFVASVRSKDNSEQLNKQALLRMFLNSYIDNETLLKMVVSVNHESTRVQNILVT